MEGRTGVTRGLLTRCAALLAGVSLLLSVPLAATRHDDAPGIDWYQGDVEAAFAAAGQQHKPVFLYWGAKWCPPCMQLKSSVFARADFIARTRQFVAVYLDGDDPGAQRWGEKFHVSGYPTVVILRPDQHEVTRLSGGMDLSLYAELLDNAEGDIRPIADVLAALRADPAALKAADCQRLAYYGWELTDFSAEERTALGASLRRAAAGCAAISATERARLTVIAAALSGTAESVTQVSAILGDASLAAPVADVLQWLDEPFFATVIAAGPAVSGPFRDQWVRVMQALADDPHRTDTDRLYALAARLTVEKQFLGKQPLPAALVDDARSRCAQVLARTREPYVRAGVVNVVSAIYEVIGDDAAEEALLREEVRTAHSPFYYMADLGDLEEKHGHKAEALAWYARAYRTSTGEATRFQWGNIYLGALLRLAPDDSQRIRATARALLATLDGPDRIQARTRRGLERLDGRLRQWNATHRHDSDLAEIRRTLQGICARLPAGDAGLDSCRQFLAGTA